VGHLVKVGSAAIVLLQAQVAAWGLARASCTRRLIHR
jgi:hypothetical protein